MAGIRSAVNEALFQSAKSIYVQCSINFVFLGVLL